jgi:hypothetical protein
MSQWLFPGLPFRGIRRASEYSSEDYKIPGLFVPRSVVSRNRPNLGMQYPGLGDFRIRSFSDEVLPGVYSVLGLLVLGIFVLGLLVMRTGILDRRCPKINGMCLFIGELLYFCRDFSQR